MPSTRVVIVFNLIIIEAERFRKAISPSLFGLFVGQQHMCRCGFELRPEPGPFSERIRPHRKSVCLTTIKPCGAETDGRNKVSFAAWLQHLYRSTLFAFLSLEGQSKGRAHGRVSARYSSSCTPSISGHALLMRPALPARLADTLRLIPTGTFPRVLGAPKGFLHGVTFCTSRNHL